MRNHLIGRRRFLVAAGAGALGVTVLNTLTACSSESESPDAAAADSAAASSPAGGTVAGDWRRVDLPYVAAYLLIRNGEAAVVDLGTPGSGSAIEEGLRAAGSGWDAVRHVILTHQHEDHVGSLSEVQDRMKAVFYAGEADVAGITAARQLKPVADGDEVFGLRIVGTPGHTLGHVSIFDPSTGVLVAGDALTNETGLAGSNPAYTADGDQAKASVRKLAALDVKAILPGHGAPVTSGAAGALRQLAASLPR